MKTVLNIITPIYFEEENITETVEGVFANVKTPFKMYLIYDVKSDPTLKVVKVLQKKYKGLFLVKNRYGRGALNALKTGFRIGGCKLVLPVMGDGCDNPRDIDKMVTGINKGSDLVCGSRYSKNGKKINGPFFKGIMSKIACRILHYIVGVPTNDSTSSFKCYRQFYVDTVKIQSKGGFELPLELTVKAYAEGLKISEIPTIWKERQSGKSKFRLFKWLPQYLRWFWFALRYKMALEYSIVKRFFLVK